MKGKWLEHLKHIKKEQWIVYLLLGALLLVIFLPVEKKEQEGKTEEEAGEQIPEEGYEPYRSQTEELEEKLERAPVPGGRGGKGGGGCCHWNPPIRKWWRRMCPLPGAVRKAPALRRAAALHRSPQRRARCTRRTAMEVKRLMWSGENYPEIRGCSGSSPGRRGTLWQFSRSRRLSWRYSGWKPTKLR